MRNYHKELIVWHKKCIKRLTNDYMKEVMQAQNYYENFIKGKEVPPKKLGKLNRMRKTARATNEAIDERRKDLEFLQSIPKSIFNRIYGWGYSDGADREARRGD